MADESLTFRAFGQDVSAGRMFGDLADKADDAGDSIHGLGNDSHDLDARLDETRRHLHALIGDFEKTGDVSLFRDIRKDRSTISLLESLRKELRSGGEADGEDVGRTFGKGVSKGLADTVGSIPSQLKGAAIVGLVGAAAAVAPLVGAAIGGAVVGGVGLGGIIGGIALAAQDGRVKSEGAKLGAVLLGDLKGSASPFIGPLLAEFGELQEIGASFSADLHAGFVQLAPLIKPLVEGLRGLFANLGPGLLQTFKTAEPVIRALANELPDVGDAISDMLESMAGNSREATLGMIGLMRATEGLFRATGFLIGQLEYEFSWLVNLGDKLQEVDEQLDKLGFLRPNLGFGFSYLTDQASAMTDELNDANNATGDFNTTIVGLEGSMYDVVTATDAARNALMDFASRLQDEFDPTAKFIHALRDVKQAQRDYTEAVRDHGRKSQEARDAELRQAEAILRMNAAAAAAAGTFNGRFSDSLRATLKAGHMTEAQIQDLEKSARSLRHELENLQGNYKATITAEFLEYRKGERDLSRRASGGPVMAGQSYWVGESGPEIVTFGSNGNVIPAGRSAAMAAGATMAAAPPRVIIDVTGADEEMKRFIRKIVRLDGGGDVQVAFGQN